MRLLRREFGGSLTIPRRHANLNQELMVIVVGPQGTVVTVFSDNMPTQGL
jgi:hypothetical protein